MSAVMTLAEDARDRDDRLLLPRGTVVDDARLAMLRERGAVAVLVEGSSAEETGEQGGCHADPDVVAKRLDWLFRACENDEATRTLRESLMRYRLEPSE